jgi:hypothetical protein
LVSTQNLDDAWMLFPQTLLTVSSSNQEIGRVRDVGCAFQESDLQKTVFVI